MLTFETPIKTQSGESLDNLKSTLSGYSFFISAWYTYKDTRVIVVTNDETAAQEIQRTMENGAEYRNVRATGSVRLSEYDAHEIVFYDKVSDMYRHEFNQFEHLRQIITPETKLHVISVKDWAGTYRWQHVCKVAIYGESDIEWITGLVGYVIGYDDKNHGIRCDTSDYAPDIAGKLGYALFGAPMRNYLKV